MAITNSIDLSTLEVGTEYYFQNSGDLIEDKDQSKENEFSGSELEEFNFQINFTGELNKYLIKNIVIYCNNLTTDDDTQNGNERDILFEDKPTFTINQDIINIPEGFYEHEEKAIDFGGRNLAWNGKYTFTIPSLVKLDDPLKISFNLKALIGGASNEFFYFGVIFTTKYEFDFINKLNQMYEYNQINEMVKKLMNNRDKLLEQNSKNQTIIRARELIKKKIEFHKYWINILYEIIFYTHLVLVVIVILMLLYKLL